MAAVISVLAMTSVCAFTDALYGKVSNKWLILWAGAAVICLITGKSAAGAASAAAGAVLPVVCLAVFFHFRLIGAGDIKLLCVTGAFMGAPAILYCMLITFSAAAAVTVIRCLPGRKEIREIMKTRIHVAVYIFLAAAFWAGGIYR